VAAQSNAPTCGLSLAGIASSNPSGDIDVCLLCVLCFQIDVSGQADHSSRGFLPIVVCLSVIMIDSEETQAH
jgi:hypothetical protein